MGTIKAIATKSEWKPGERFQLLNELYTVVREISAAEYQALTDHPFDAAPVKPHYYAVAIYQ